MNWKVVLFGAMIVLTSAQAQVVKIACIGNSPKPVIWLCLPLPAWPVNGNKLAGIDGVIIENEVIPIIKQVATERKLSLIDLHTPFLNMQAHPPDGVHPDDVGHDSIAAIIYRALSKPVAVLPPLNASAFPELDLRGRDLMARMDGNLSARLSIADPLGKSLEAWDIPAGAPHSHRLAGFAPGVYLLGVQSTAGYAVKRLELH